MRLSEARTVRYGDRLRHRSGYEFVVWSVTTSDYGPSARNFLFSDERGNRWYGYRSCERVPQVPS